MSKNDLSKLSGDFSPPFEKYAPSENIAERHAPDVHEAAERRKPEECQRAQDMKLVADGDRPHQVRIGCERHNPPDPRRQGVQHVIMPEENIVHSHAYDNNQTAEGDPIVHRACSPNPRVG